MEVYLSHGLGLNSWALYLLLIEQGEIPGETFEAVAVDHGTDWPESYEYLAMMQGKGYPVTVVRPDSDGCDTVYGFCDKWKMIPSRKPGSRWCTQRFKVAPLKKHYQTPCIELIGFDLGENQRKTGLAGKVGVEQDFPLINAGIDRGGCESLIKRHGLPVPIKSGCYICPFQTRRQWIELREKHPDLFCKAKRLEELTNERRRAANKLPVYFRDIPLENLIQGKSKGRRQMPGQQEIFEDHGRPPCRCGL